MSGTRSCRGSARGRPTGTGSAGPGPRPGACGATQPSCCSTPTRGRSAEPSRSGPRYSARTQADPGKASTLDSSAHVPRSLVTDPQFDWQDDNRPWHRYADTVLYEIHVKGFTMRHPDIPPPLRGTYAGLGHEAAIGHLLDLGVTTVELLPVHQNVPESFLVQRGLTNYWGYNTIGFFAPHNGYSAAVRAGRPGGQVSRVQGDGGRAAPGRPGSGARRGVQPHRRGGPRRPSAVLPRHRQHWPTTGSSPATPASTSTRPAAATR